MLLSVLEVNDTTDTESVVKVSILDVQVSISVGSYNALWVHP